MAENKGIFGTTCITEDKAVCIPIARYDELIKKEAFYDELVKDTIVSVKLLSNTICKEDN